MKFPDLHWRVSHGAGAFPDIQDRFLLGFPKHAEEAREVYATRFWYDSAGPVFPKHAEEAREVYATRFWYDSAGPVFPRQIKGLLAHDVPVSQFVFGTVSASFLRPFGPFCVTCEIHFTR
jgi:hypothetical protein